MFLILVYFLLLLLHLCLTLSNSLTAMVDRITPAMNADLRASLNSQSGINDRIPVVSEDFVQWVLEDKFGYGRPAFESVGE